MQGLGQVPGSAHVVVVVHAVHELLARVPLLAQVHLVVVDGAELGPTLFGQADIVKADAIARRVDMQLAHRLEHDSFSHASLLSVLALLAL